MKNELTGILTQDEINNFPVIDYEEKKRFNQENIPSRIKEDKPKENTEDEEFTIADIKEMCEKNQHCSSWSNIRSENVHCLFCGYENDSIKGLIFTKTDGLQKYKLKDDIVELVNLKKDHIRAEGIEAIEFYIEIKSFEYNNEVRA